MAAEVDTAEDIKAVVDIKETETTRKVAMEAARAATRVGEAMVAADMAAHMDNNKAASAAHEWRQEARVRVAQMKTQYSWATSVMLTSKRSFQCSRPSVSSP